MNDMNFNLIIDFLTKIGIKVIFEEIHEPTFLPGLKIYNGSLVIDKSKLTNPGDTLHEAGHIAVTGKDIRPVLNYDMPDENSFSAANEMAAIAWSYAACKHLNIEPAYVFHENGYKGDSPSIIENFNTGRYFGVPMLQYYGMTRYINPADPTTETQCVYPSMICWLSQMS